MELMQNKKKIVSEYLDRMYGQIETEVCRINNFISIEETFRLEEKKLNNYIDAVKNELIWELDDKINEYDKQRTFALIEEAVLKFKLPKVILKENMFFETISVKIDANPPQTNDSNKHSANVMVGAMVGAVLVGSITSILAKQIAVTLAGAAIGGVIGGTIAYAITDSETNVKRQNDTKIMAINKMSQEKTRAFVKNRKTIVKNCFMNFFDDLEKQLVLK